MKYEFLLIDADDTLFDFQKSAEVTFKKVCQEIGLDYKDDYYLTYKDINQKYWDLYSVGKVSKSHLKKYRFVDFGKAIGVEVDYEKMISLYESNLSNTAFLLDSTIPTLNTLKTLPIKLYLITNGTASVQRGRLKVSGLERYFDGIFISDEIGYSKPSKEFLNHVENNVLGFDKDKTLIVGDSLVSDVALAVENGIDICFYNPKNVKTDIKTTYQIDDLIKLIDIVKEL